MAATLNIVILAAGKGTRMKSSRAKVLHPLAGKPMLGHVLDRARELNPAKICGVIGYGREEIRAAFASANDIVWTTQEPQLGTGHAVLQALPQLEPAGVTLVLYGDVPLISHETLRSLVAQANDHTLVWLTHVVADATGFGRIVRDNSGNAIAIVEHKDATDAQRANREINTGILVCPTAWLREWLPNLGNKNAQGEYYLTDILALAVAAKRRVVTHAAKAEWEISGINSKDQLAQLERIHQRHLANLLMQAGVTLADPARIDVRGMLTCGSDVEIDVNCVFEGKVTLGDQVKIGANSILKNCSIGSQTEIAPYTLIDSATIGQNTRIGPYARIRPGTTLADEVHIGNFVEVKASEIGHGSKANHLSYIGDTTIGTAVNVGAGTITCNYDGANKHRTVIEDNVHIGSDVQLVAPVTISQGSTIAAGTTVWKDTPANALTLNAKTQVSKPDWVRPKKKK